MPLVLVAYLSGRASLRHALAEVLVSKSVVLLGGGVLIGLLGGASGYQQVRRPSVRWRRARRTSLLRLRWLWRFLDANPAYSLTAALGVTFPFNLVIGIPLYLEVARGIA